MSDKQLAEVVCSALLAIVAAIRKKYNLPSNNGVTIEIKENDDLAGIISYQKQS